MENVGLLIPALNPNEKLIKLLDELKDFKNIVIVDDGSTDKKIFKQLRNVQIITHKTNLGKGQALKTGIKYFKEKTNVKSIITCDSDFQHTPKDIKKVTLKTKDKIVLGCRDFDKNVPFKSKIGNQFSSLYFKLLTGINLKDTQTGLRGIPRKYFDLALNTNGERFEYEMNFLIKLKQKDIEIITIETIYEQDRTTHFNFIKDSYRIYKSLFRNIISSISSFIVDIISFIILSNIIKYKNYVFISSIIARLISGIYNFTLNKLWTFDAKNTNNTLKETQKYLCLFVFQMLVSSFFTQMLNNKTNFGLLLIKIFVDIIIFIFNFIIQKKIFLINNKIYQKRINSNRIYPFIYFY